MSVIGVKTIQYPDGPSSITINSSGNVSMPGTLSVTGVSSFANGTNSAPSLTFTSDTNTGIYRGGTDILKFVTAGTDAITIDASQNVDVNGTVTSDGLTVDTSADGIVSTFKGNLNYFHIKGSGADTILSTVGSGGNASNLFFQTDPFTSEVNRMQINKDGDISFYEDTGTTPKLLWDASEESLTIEGFTETPYISLGNTSNSYQTVTGSSDGNDLTYRAYQNHIFKNTTGASSSTDGTERMRIDASGNVGIGTSSPSQKLDVNGTIIASTTSSQGARIERNGTTGGANFDSVLASGSLHFRTGATERVRIDSSGNVGIGTASPNTNGLHVEKSASNAMGVTVSNTEGTGSRLDIYALGSSPAIQSAHRTAVYQWTGSGIDLWSRVGDLHFGTNNSERMRITSAGNVGIGTSSPADVPLTVFSGGAGTYGQLKLGYDNSAYWQIGRIDIAGTGGGNFQFKPDGGTSVLDITSSGNVGIGTSSPVGKIQTDIGTPTVMGLKAISGLNITNNAGSVGYIYQIGFGYQTGTTYLPAVIYALTTSNAGYNNNAICFATRAVTTDTAPLERLRISSSGHVLVNTTSKISTDQGQGFAVHANTSSSGSCMEVKNTGNPASNRDFIRFYNTSNGEAGSIEHNGTSSVAFLTSSDYRLKENVSYDFDATTRLKQLKPARFNFIADGNDKVVDGFLAHEVSGIVPEAISGEKDAINEDGSINPQSIDQSKLVPLLVKTIQELEARIVASETANTALEARITALENT